MKKISLIFALFLLAICSKADEGMWLLKELNKQSAVMMKDLGFTFPIDSIYSETNPSLKDAVVIFGRGCTGVAVSQQGLIFTNHHCGYGDIQKLSSLEHDYLKDGFASHSFEEEIPAPGLTVSFLDRTEDITTYLTSTLAKEDDEMTRYTKIDSLSKVYLKQFEDKPFIQSRIVPFYSENKYYLVQYKVFNDVRMVFTPPSSVGKFGGETDNWMWPRHTGDFSVFRVYADANNNPADYNEDNVPFQPKYSVPVSLKGYEDKSYSMTIGYPGSTQRYMPSWGITQMVKSEHKPRIAVRGVKQDIWRAAMNADDATRIKYASKYAGSSNYWKNAMGMNEAIAKLGVIADKQQLEAEFAEWVSKKKDRKAKYGNTLPLLEKSYTNSMQAHELATYFIETFYSGMEIVKMANTYLAVLNNEEENKVEQLQNRTTTAYKDYDPALDQKVVAALMQLYAESVPADYLPSIYTRINDEFNEDYELYADWLFKNTKIASLEAGETLVSMEDKEAAMADPAIELAKSASEIFITIQFMLRENNDGISQGNREYMAGLMEMNPKKAFSPDANFTQRLSYGSVGGYSPADGVWYDYYTTSFGVLDKEVAGDPEFGVQDYVLDHIESGDFGQYADKDGTMKVNFLSNNDITGGNSGSPVFNGQAELIGLAFDGNWEALSGDIVFNQELQRCINVDIRYVLYIIDKVMECPRLIDELKLKK